ncbi:hypothetical protein [Kitasatospora phosalacinea]|uniref:Uncharacterized protein n=1 Tax=Kitasatospora phosalacinea TaxID=2065 RepID=A0A9W6UQZ7_9ACTN|nr:hypothetical protein [Kitasatospora phosalacinea]GLW59036.1 hypothetical protein Kpho01_70460 [Kitasatospora phosalacinea]
MKQIRAAGPDDRAALPRPEPEPVPVPVPVLAGAPHEGPGVSDRELRAEHPSAVNRFRR